MFSYNIYYFVFVINNPKILGLSESLVLVVIFIFWLSELEFTKAIGKGRGEECGSVGM